MKLTIRSESTSNNSSGDRSNTFEITDSDATLLIDWDYRQQQADPDVKQPKRRTAQQAADVQFSNPEYNNWHGYHRQDRKGVRFSSFETWNEHGDQPVGATQSAEELYLERCAEEAADQRAQVVRSAINALPPVQRVVVEAVFDEGKRSVQVAVERGVSPAAISKTLKTALRHIEQVVLASGVNDSEVSGLPSESSPRNPASQIWLSGRSQQ